MTPARFQPGQEYAAQMDAQDPLAHLRERFYIPRTKSEKECIYLCGHSLGLQPKSAQTYIDEMLKDWAELGVEGHFHAGNPWLRYHRLLTEPTATLVGAESTEVVVMNSLTTNLHLMMTSFYRPTPQRHKILMEHGAFPTDQYAVKSQICFHGYEPSRSLIELVPREGESSIRDEDVESLIEREGESIALILLGGVNYATGQLFDLAEITKAGHRKGCIVAFDLAHAVANVPLRLHEWGPDFAVWCSYKYLNGGPGCAGGCFVHERHCRAWDLPRYAGWWAHDEKTRFEMGPDFHPMPGAEGWQLSNPPILALAPLRTSMDIFSEVGIDRLRKKSRLLTGYMEFLLAEKASSNYSIITPADPERRGAQLSIRVPSGRKVCDRLASQGVIGDWREPDIYRVAPAPLYNSFRDIYSFVKRFSEAFS
ncbi:MAG TPA: kynureninase [Candidatus Sulfotelmatobacter sp.]|nr:kynureninase [Candidatus Sulfotelmatobacter sp.]